MNPGKSLAVLMPVFNRFEVTRKGIEELLKLGFKEEQMVVIDDSSPDHSGTRLLEVFPELTVLYGDGQRFWSGSLNIGIKHVLMHKGITDVLVVNDDLEFRDSFFEELSKVYYGNSRKCAVGAVALINDDSGKEFVRSCGSIRSSRGFGHKFTGVEYSNLVQWTKGEVLEVDGLSGHVILLPIEAFAEVGLFDEKRFRQYWGDIDFTLRMKSRGYGVYCATSSVVVDDKNATGVTLTQLRLTIKSLKLALFDWRSPYRICSMVPFYYHHCPFVDFLLIVVRVYLKIFFVAILNTFLGKRNTRGVLSKSSNNLKRL